MNYYLIAILGSPLEPFTYHSPNIETIGTKVQVEFRNRTLYGVILSSCEEPEFKTNPILEQSEFYYSANQLNLAKFISIYYFCSLGDALGLMVAHSLEKTVFEGTLTTDIKLTSKQISALEFLQKEKVSLLFGDTGSGKTEIYMRYFESIISQKKRVIFLMPEISLTPQMGIRLEKQFGESVVIWHSKLTPFQKEKRWLKYIVVRQRL